MWKQHVVGPLRVILAVAVMVSGLCYASDPNESGTDDLTAMSLEELMDVEVEVTSASKTPIALNRAPGTVYSFTGDELWAKGIVTIEDLLRQIPGVQMIPNRQGHTSVWFRGVQGRYNSKIMLVVDGVPTRDFYYGNFTVDEMYPVEHIERIEVLLGPGSVLYGSGAFAGVINITTKKNKNEAYGSASTFDTYSGSAHVSYGDASFFFKQLSTHSGFSPEFGKDGEVRRWEQDMDRDLYIFDLKYDLLDSLTFKFNKTRYEYPVTYSKYSRTQSIIIEPMTLSLDFHHGDLDSGKVNVVGYYSDYDFKENTLKIEKSGAKIPKEVVEEIWDTKYMGFDAYYSRRFKDHTFLFGSSFLWHRATDDVLETDIDWNDPVWELDDQFSSLADTDRTYNDYAFYAQDQWKVNDKLDLTFGARYDSPDEFDKEWSFRVGSVYALNKETFIKALFGTAFRVPTYREFRKLDGDGAAIYDPGIAPERMKTFELAIGQNKANGNSWLLTGFYNKYIDFIIDEYDAVVGDEIFHNFDERTVKGVEFSGNYWIKPKQLNLSGGVTYMDHYDKVKRDELHGMANWLGFAELTYHVFDGFTIGLNAQYVSRPHVDSDYQTGIPGARVNSGMRDDHLILGAHATYELNKNVQLQFVGRNITDTRYHSPHFAPSTDYDYEWPGAEFIFRARILF